MVLTDGVHGDQDLHIMFVWDLLLLEVINPMVELKETLLLGSVLTSFIHLDKN